MMTREQRAKQFMPFDAMKGLKEALEAREERHSRVEKHGISAEQAEENNRAICRIGKGSRVCLACHIAFHDVEVTGTVTEIDLILRYLRLDDGKIPFDDIYEIRLVSE